MNQLDLQAEITSLLAEVTALREAASNYSVDLPWNDPAVHWNKGRASAYFLVQKRLEALSESLGAPELAPPKRVYRAQYCPPTAHTWTGCVDGTEYCVKCGMEKGQ